MKRKWIPAALIMLVWLASCAPSRYVRPLEKGEIAVSGTFGGSFFRNFGPPLPLPFTAISGAYGIDSNLTAYAAFHPTAAAFGVIQFDMGVSWGILKPDGLRPGLSFNPALNLAADVWDGRFKIWPQTDLNAYWEYGERKNYAYTGFSCWYELAGKRAHGEPQPQFFLPGFQIGNTFSRESWDYTMELKVNNLAGNNEDLTIDWIGLGSAGAMGFYLGFTKRF